MIFSKNKSYKKLLYGIKYGSQKDLAVLSETFSDNKKIKEKYFVTYAV
jgi:hypothetical protein